MNAPYVPGAWYDLDSRLSAARTVVNAIGCYMPEGVKDQRLQGQLEDVHNLLAAAEDILKLCHEDCAAMKLDIENLNLPFPWVATPPTDTVGNTQLTGV